MLVYPQDEERIYNYQQRLERFKQFTKRKYTEEIGPLIKEETIAVADWNTKVEKIQQHCFGHKDPKRHIK